MFFPEGEAFSDFIFGVICEEFGFRGAVLLLSGIGLLLLQAVFVAFSARDQVGGSSSSASQPCSSPTPSRMPA
jgi:rod shape determining protein RodA